MFVHNLYIQLDVIGEATSCMQKVVALILFGNKLANSLKREMRSSYGGGGAREEEYRSVQRRTRKKIHYSVH